MPSRKTALGHGHPHLLLGEVPGWRRDSTCSPRPGGTCPRGHSYGVEDDGQGRGALFPYKRNFLGLAGLAQT